MSVPSYEKINYALRPAKNIERKMIVETLSRLRAFYTLESYRYVGFGSPYFADFALVHRSMGIQDMICIEQETGDKGRFEFNRPYNCIELGFGKSTAVLPGLKWQERPTIVWLDYDDPLDSTMLSDIDVVGSSLTSGSFFLMSVRSSAGDFGVDPSQRLDQLTSALGDKVPAGTSPRDTTSSTFGGLLWRIIDSEIRYIVNERSAGLRPDLRFNYRQVLHFSYRDGTPMLTVGGVLYQEGQRVQLTQCDFEALYYNRASNDPYDIVVPPLTFKEIQAIDAQLPDSIPSLPGVPKSHVSAYADNYRYFPNYVEAEV